MNIISVNRKLGIENYQLKENNSTVLKICYKPGMQIARIDTDRERRVLIIEDAGFLHSKVIINNEYGVRIGALVYDNFSSSHGSVEIEGTRFRFSLQQAPQPELHIYRGSRSNLIYSCRLSVDENNFKTSHSGPSAFIIAVSWYLFLKNSPGEKLALSEAIIS